MSDPDISQKDTYFVAVKLFLEKNGSFFIFKDRFGEWDLPGGRIKKQEFETPLKDVIKRKISEELGGDVRYSLEDRPSVLMRHERVEMVAGNPTIRIFALGYRAQWECGEPALSDAHTEMKWVNMKTFIPKDYFTDGWLKGVEEYLEVSRG